MSWGRLSTRPLAPEDDWFVEPDVGPSAGHEEPRERRTSDPEPREGATGPPESRGAKGLGGERSRKLVAAAVIGAILFIGGALVGTLAARALSGGDETTTSTLTRTTTVTTTSPTTSDHDQPDDHTHDHDADYVQPGGAAARRCPPQRRRGRRRERGAGRAGRTRLLSKQRGRKVRPGDGAGRPRVPTVLRPQAGRRRRPGDARCALSRTERAVAHAAPGAVRTVDSAPAGHGSGRSRDSATRPAPMPSDGAPLRECPSRTGWADPAEPENEPRFRRAGTRRRKSVADSAERVTPCARPRVWRAEDHFTRQLMPLRAV